MNAVARKRFIDLYMKRISMPMLGVVSAVIGGCLIYGTTQSRLWGKDTSNNPPAKLNVQNTPINREAGAVTSYAPIIKRAAPSVVNIYSTRTLKTRRPPMSPFFNDPMFRQFFGDDDSDSPRGDGHPPRPRKQQGLGSGVIVTTDGYILTANHVVEGADPDGVKVAMASGGKEYQAKVVGTDPSTDVAVLKIAADDLAAITIADSDKLEVGDIVIAIGNPFGVGQTVTMGMVSALGRASLGIIPGGYENFIQTDAPINQGNSGGALIDADGRLVGINTAIFSPSGANAGIGFAVPANLARNVMEQLINSGKVTRGYLGVGLQPEISPELAKEFNLPDTTGAMVTEVMPNTPAAKAGLQSGDVVRSVDDKKISDRDQLRLMVSQMAPGTKITLKVLRSENGKPAAEKTITATLGTLKAEDMAGGGNDKSQPEGKSEMDGLDGVEVADLDASMHRQFNIPSSVNGAIVSNIDPNSNSAEAGIRQGDVIQEIDRQPVKGAEDAVKLSDSAKGDHVVVRVWRQGGSFFITVDNTKRK
jgi:serine protease Do